jgi:hypothetical protein
VAKVKISFDEEATKFYYGFEYEAVWPLKKPSEYIQIPRKVT